jgi:hypothetical protein
MLRLVLNWFQVHHVLNHCFAFAPEATWFSESLLPSPFRPRHRGDRRAEARTHADGIIGHFIIGSNAKADATLLPNANQLVVAEAKIHSPLSGSTRNAPGYDQAARNVACIAELLNRAKRKPSELKTLAFVVLVPEVHSRDGSILDRLDKLSIQKVVQSRAEAFSPELDGWLLEWFIPTLNAITIKTLSWEQVIRDIADVDQKDSRVLEAFYNCCLMYNLPSSSLVDRPEK